ncbi:sodium/hydrogen exchanger [Gloeomargarita lithophora Alchichica-D10]|uniref:Sodium/hydrogen exchanger n=1 Tax=Gloeomargarita lithophora Alchichica-D10 TaxID=1188229 RepID=A0A1J0AFJ2_9CYAN|nr:potassium/proton antiporter [Gloeomargarita lithophora]APB34708.1 sodium/hydrogen exchanger [Gloeomargarita lithophora Alchichica-D10]
MPSIELVGFVAGILLLVSIFASKLANQFGVPSLLLFLFTGWLVEHFTAIDLTNPAIAKFVGDFALIFIIFTGGLDTRWQQVKPVIFSGVKLATLGVLLTMLLMGIFIWLILGSYSTFSLGTEGLPLNKAFLLAAIISSTDAAAVFSVLRSSRTELRGNLQPLLELESSSNDPMAVLLTTTILSQMAGENISILASGMMLISQLLIGTLLGYGLGRLDSYLLNHLGLATQGLYAVGSLALVLFIYSFSVFLNGNGYLAVYVAGLVLGNHPLIHREYISNFHEGFTWLMQIIMFVTLGMLSVPYQATLGSLALVAVIIGLFLMFVARPVSVFVSLAGSGIPWREQGLIAWVGLRGAVPIVLATFPLALGMEQAGEMFVVVSILVVMSLLGQGFTLATVARWLGLTAPGEIT